MLAVNPLQAAQFRRRLGVSGAKSDAGDAHVLADMVRTHAHELRPVAGDSPQAEAVKVVTRTHKTLIWERTRHTQRLRHALRDYFPAVLVAFDDLDAADTLELLAKAPTPAQAAGLSLAQISAALKRARRKNVTEKAAAIQAALRTEHLGQPAVVAAAYAASVQAVIAVLAVLNTQVKVMEGQVEAHFGRHPAAEIIASQPGLGPVPLPFHRLINLVNNAGPVWLRLTESGMCGTGFVERLLRLCESAGHRRSINTGQDRRSRCHHRSAAGYARAPG